VFENDVCRQIFAPKKGEINGLIRVSKSGELRDSYR
jgi:hypothetical protein